MAEFDIVMLEESQLAKQTEPGTIHTLGETNLRFEA
jgi:hypothetical protein